jgi:sugar phosphate isomerase/epimerase
MQELPISWMPVRLLQELREGSIAPETWMRTARDYGLQGVELHHTILESHDSTYLHSLRKFAEDLNLKISLITCSPDFAHPSKAVRQAHVVETKRYLVSAQKLGATGVRVTTGVRHPFVAESDGISWVTECLKEIADLAEQHGVIAALENHYMDRLSEWNWPDFAQRSSVFFAIFDQLQDTPLRINFDCSNALMIGEDPLQVLDHVKDKVSTIHASDRFMGSYQHSVVGEGAVPYQSIFGTLKTIGFEGWISIEDGNPYGAQGFLRSLRNVRSMISEA